MMAAIPSTNHGSQTMKKDEVQIGGVYSAKVSDKTVDVRIDAENAHGGWDATNLSTGKKVRIKTAARLQPSATRERGQLRGVAAADQENARLRDERAASPDGMTASERVMARSAESRKRRGKTADEPAAKKLSCLDAAARVLAEADEPLNAKQMIDAITAKGYWSSPGGKTPHATLYSAILREISTKGNDARFRKTERGKFTTNA
jgi:hypothetical protein